MAERIAIERVSGSEMPETRKKMRMSIPRACVAEGVLLSAKIDDAEVERANAAVNSAPAVDIAARGAEYRKEGWTRFDETAAPYSIEDIERDRARYGSIPRN
jgi:hypothetical protein